MNALLGPTEPDPFGLFLGTGYQRFESPCGIHGLAKESGDRLDVLAVYAAEAGKGQFREFIRLAKEQFQTVCVWFDDNPALGPALKRYGFTPETEIDGSGEVLTGWRWDKTP